jgi:putative Mg2+ transporter-C (MgtC) family protein
MTGIELLYPVPWWEMMLRLGLAIFCGGIIGLEREVDEKPAGLRTHMLVSLGSAIFVMTAIQTGLVQDTADTISRIIQGIATGIGFLGAGEIFRVTRSKTGRVRVRGLTTAAAVWVSTSLGVAAACGLWFMCIFSVAASFLILNVAKRIEQVLADRRRS